MKHVLSVRDMQKGLALLRHGNLHHHADDRGNMRGVLQVAYETHRDFYFSIPDLPARPEPRSFGFLFWDGKQFVLRGKYRFDGCSVKFVLFDSILVGVWDGPMIQDGSVLVPEMFWPSACHDSGYEFLEELAAYFGVSIRRMREMLDRLFYALALQFSSSPIRAARYYSAVRKGGGWLVFSRLRNKYGWIKALKVLAQNGGSL
jgi:hypothetical protein